MGCCLFTSLVAALHAGQIVPGPVIAVLGDCISIWGVDLTVAVGLYGHLGATVSKIPDLFTMGVTKGPDLEGHGITRA